MSKNYSKAWKRIDDHTGLAKGPALMVQDVLLYRPAHLDVREVACYLASTATLVVSGQAKKLNFTHWRKIKPPKGG